MKPTSQKQTKKIGQHAVLASVMIAVSMATIFTVIRQYSYKHMQAGNVILRHQECL